MTTASTENEVSGGEAVLVGSTGPEFVEHADKARTTAKANDEYFNLTFRT
jgi:hypothetical protein